MDHNTFIARVRNDDNTPQELIDHLFAVSEISERISSKINLPLMGRLIGLLHDLGKYSSAFQDYIRDVTGMNGKGGQKRTRGEVDHSTAGAQKIWNELGNKDGNFHLLAAQMLATCIAGHHGGLPDFIGPQGDSEFLRRMLKPASKSFIDEVEKKCDFAVKAEAQKILFSTAILEELKPSLVKIHQNEKSSSQCEKFHYGLLTRFLFSSLIDADRLNSADFDKPHFAKLRGDGSFRTPDL